MTRLKPLIVSVVLRLVLNLLLNFIIVLKRYRFQVNGVVIDTSSKLIPFSLRRNLLLEKHERQEAYFVKKYISRDFDVLEVGSGVGYISNLIAKSISQNSRHVILEGYPEMAELTKKNLALNKKKAEVINRVISYGSQEITFFRNIKPSWSSCFKSKGSIDSIQIQAITISDILFGLGFQPDLFVIDCEGVEYDIILWDIEALRVAKYLIIEFHPLAIGSEKVAKAVNRLFQSGFQYVSHMANVFVFQQVGK